MSYILDALRKAEAERERGNVPNIHAQPAFAGARPGAAPARSRLWIVVLVLGALLVLAAVVVAYLLLGRSPASDAAIASAKPAAPAAQTPTVTAAAVTVAPPPAVVASLPAVTAAPSPAPVPAAARKARPVPAAPASAAVPAPAPAASAAEERVYAISELPDNIRQQLPTLSVGGSMYSTAAANRLVIVNGQVLHEGERITPELTVLQIKSKSAVLGFKGYRYTLPF